MKRAADYPENAVEQTILTPGDFGLADIESVSYSRYTKNWRANEARRRLRETDDSVAAIAHDLGYASSQHLAVQFKRTFGRTPSECRNRRNGT